MSRLLSKKRPTAGLLLLASVFLLAVATLAQSSDNGSQAGAAVTNQAGGAYETDGTNINGTSVTVTQAVKAVAGVRVTPDDTSPSANTAPGERVTKVFSICNAGNGPDSFTIPQLEVTSPSTLVSLHFDNDASGTLTDGDTAITIGATASPILAAGHCIGVIVVVDVNNSVPDSTETIRLTARSTSDQATGGVAEDQGTIILAVGNRPRFTS